MADPAAVRHTPISEHGLIGDLQTAALVATDGTIDWFCAPRFDSPSIFASILDQQKGGLFRIAAVADEVVVKQLYLPSSAILVTRFLTSDGVAEVVDFMPVHEPTQATDHHRIVRLIQVVRGEVEFELECRPRFDYGREEHSLLLTDHHATFSTPEMTTSLWTGCMLEADGSDVTSRFTLKAGERLGAIFETSPDDREPGKMPRDVAPALFAETNAFWSEWMGRCTYRGRWREMVHRSAITLKLMTYAPSGGIVAAPTAALPEEPGGERNWDYRYTWVRDGSFSVGALMALGYEDEADAFLRWLSDRVNEQAGEDSGPLKIMYRVDGSSDLVEETLDHLSGYEGAAPVRIGNGAADQLQLDIYGEAFDALYFGEMNLPSGRRVSHRAWEKLRGVADWLCDNWDSVDAGIWETRGGPKDFVYSRLMCWVAFDRAIRLANHHAMPGDVERWMTERNAIYEQVMERGFNPEIGAHGAFVQHYGSDVLDASILKMPQVGFIAPRDPMWISTLDAMNEQIVSDSLVYRYNPEASPDGLRGGEGTFSLCTFWYVDALAQAGRVDEARLVFEKMLTYANHLGLYSEEIWPTGAQLGNFPQAFTHLALVSAAIRLDRTLG